MSRILPLKFSMPYRISFSTNIRGHHVYKSVCDPEKSEKLERHKDDRDESSMTIMPLEYINEKRISH